jgi:hypothetical protein
MAASVSILIAVLAPVEKYPDGVGEAVGRVTLVVAIIEDVMLTDATTETVLFTGAGGSAVVEKWSVWWTVT